MAKRSVMEQETLKIFITALGLVVLQAILNLFGIGGILTAICMYLVAILISSMFIIDRDGVQSSNAVKIKAGYMGMVGTDILMVIVGFLMWFVAGFWVGLDKTLHAFQQPDAPIQGSFLMKFLMAAISHMTIFSALQIFTNLYRAAASAVKGKF